MRIRALFAGCIVSLILLAGGISHGHAEAHPRWSVGLKGGFFHPSLSGWEGRYDSEGDLILAFEAGYNLTRAVQIGIEAGYFSDSFEDPAAGLPRDKFKLFPFQVFFIYQLRFDEDQPIVPYLGGGFSHFTYWQSGGGIPSVSGAQEGVHARGGLAILLDRLDPQAADNVYAEWGLANTYLVGEVQFAKVSDFGGAEEDLGGWIYWGGLRFDF